MFLALLVGTMILTLVTMAPDEDDIIDLSTFADWARLAMLGWALAIATLLAWLLVALGSWRAVMIAIAGLLSVALVGQQSGIATRLATPLDITDRWLAAFAWIFASTVVLSAALWLLAKAGWSWWARPSDSIRWTSRLARAAIILVSLTLTIPTISLVWGMIPPAPSAPQSPPNPNGYVVLAETERRLNWDAVTADDPLEATVQEAVDFTRANEQLLGEMSAALDLPSQVPLDWSPDQVSSSATNIFHDVYYAWHLVAKAAHLQGNDDNDDHAADCYLNLLRASNICANGGAAVDEFVANTLATEAATRLAGMLSRLSDEQLSRIQRGAEQCLIARESIEPIVDREERLERIKGGWPGRLSAWFVKHQLSPGFEPALELPNHRAARDARLKLLIVECALQRYHLKHGNYPDKLSQITPAFLDKLPQDPFADGPFQYRRADAGYLLYSINADRIDNGGVQGEHRGLYEGDLSLP